MFFVNTPSFANCEFISCDVVPVKDGVKIANAIILDGGAFHACKLMQFTFYTLPPGTAQFVKLGAKPVGYTKDEVPRLQPPREIGAGMQR